MEHMIPRAHVTEIIHRKQEKRLLVHEEYSVLVIRIFLDPCVSAVITVHITLHR